MKMDQEKAMELVNKALYGLQRVRSMSVEELTRMGFEEGTAKRVIGDLVPWMQGEMGDAFLESLAKVSNRGSVDGIELYNFMFILHAFDRNLLMMISAVTDVMFPEPNLAWVRELGVNVEILSQPARRSTTRKR